MERLVETESQIRALGQLLVQHASNCRDLLSERDTVLAARLAEQRESETRYAAEARKSINQRAKTSLSELRIRHEQYLATLKDRHEKMVRPIHVEEENHLQEATRAAETRQMMEVKWHALIRGVGVVLFTHY
jgi:hypothetical protein